MKEYDDMIKELEELTASRLERTVAGLDKILIRCAVDLPHEEVKRLAQEYLVRGM
jgi:hypothetical protein